MIKDFCFQALDIINKMWCFIDNSNILSNIFSSLIFTGLISWFTIRILATPDFKLHVFAQKHDLSNILIFAFENRKRFITYDENDFFYTIYVPAELFDPTKPPTFREYTSEGLKGIQPVRKVPSKLINGERYVVFESSNKLKVFPKSVSKVLEIQENLQNPIDKKVFYELNTKNGRYPDEFIIDFEKSAENHIIKKVKSGLLPFAIIQ